MPINYQDYYNKILGGWTGKCAGGILGAPIEGFKRFNTIAITDELFATNFANDDLDLQVLWLDLILKKGPYIREGELAAFWKDHVEFPWGEYGVALRNLKVGLDNPDTGLHNNRYWYRGMGSPIRSEIWGMIFPGLPENAAYYARMDSTIDHHGFSVEAEMYLSACAAIAFTESDIKTILKEGLAFIPENGECAGLVNQVFDWYETNDFDVVAGKIKSLYGDADFTSAPMNIAFTILSLLRSERGFDFLDDALHLGHDSDCVIATAGALVGIAMGYDAIPEIWKQRVGNELLISPEIVDTYCPKTISKLAALTAKAGIICLQAEGKNAVTDIPEQPEPVEPSMPFAAHTKVVAFPDWSHDGTGGELEVRVENFMKDKIEVALSFLSDYFEPSEADKEISGQDTVCFTIKLERTARAIDKSMTTIPYQLRLTESKGEAVVLEKGIPVYGEWMLIGPFIKDVEAFEVSESPYPDHGLASLPSVKYMNRDKVQPEEVFTTTAEVASVIAAGKEDAQPFMMQRLRPTSMYMNLERYFVGRGERTLFLYTEVTSAEQQLRWLSLGASGYVSVWLNDKQVYASEELIRTYPYAHNAEMSLSNGTNRILIRIDFPVDFYEVEIGIKHHDQKHPHQCHWDTDLQFELPEINNH